MPGTRNGKNLTYKRILFVAPSDSGLDVAPEIDALYELGYTAQALQGEVSRRRLFDLVRGRTGYDVLHFACHANSEGVLLSHGDTMDAASITQFAKALGVTLVFLNACDTAQLGQLLVDEDIPAAICTLSNVPDVQAKETAACFYRALASTNDIRRAYHESKPPVKGGYSLFSDGALELQQFGPVLAKLDEFAAVIDANSEDHVKIWRSIELLGKTTSDTAQLKQWFLRVTVSIVGASLVIQTLIMLVGRVR